MPRIRIEATEIEDVRLVHPPRYGDARGFYSETYNARELEALGIDTAFVQDSHSLSRERGTVRGLHYQLPPYAQDKLIRVVRGSVLDVAVDVRRGSPTFGRHVARTLSAEAWNQLLVPVGFAHGFCTLEPDTEVLYKLSAYWAPEHERGILWSDPALGIDWPVTEAAAVVSEKDRALPTLAAAEDLFDWPVPAST